MINILPYYSHYLFLGVIFIIHHCLLLKKALNINSPWYYLWINFCKKKIRVRDWLFADVKQYWILIDSCVCKHLCVYNVNVVFLVKSPYSFVLIFLLGNVFCFPFNACQMVFRLWSMAQVQSRTCSFDIKSDFRCPSFRQNG